MLPKPSPAQRHCWFNLDVNPSSRPGPPAGAPRCPLTPVGPPWLPWHTCFAALSLTAPDLGGGGATHLSGTAAPSLCRCFLHAVTGRPLHLLFCGPSPTRRSSDLRAAASHLLSSLPVQYVPTFVSKFVQNECTWTASTWTAR